jgi:hypothetical protein
MTRWLWLGLVGCSEKEETYTPALSFLQPKDGATVPAGDLAVSIVVEDFELVPPEGLAHDEQGIPAGYCSLTLDEQAVADVSSPRGTVSGLTAGPHVLVGELRYADGDALQPPVAVAVSFTAE